MAETKLMVSFSVNTCDNGFAELDRDLKDNDDVHRTFKDMRAQYKGRANEGEFVFLGSYPYTDGQATKWW